MRAQLPYDVWLMISKLLSSDEIQRLYPVNQALYHISMDARYKTSFIGSLLQSDTTRSFTRLIEPDLAARVRTMTLLPGRVCHAIHQQAARQPESKFLNKVKDIKAALQRTVNKHPRGKASQTTIQRLSAKQILSNLNTIIGGLISLTVLKVVISPGDHLYFSRVDLRLFNCTPFAATLKELDLKVSVEDLPGILVPSTPHSSDPVIFPNLEILCLTLELEHKHSTEDPLTTGLLASFLNGCRRNLHTISLITGKALNPATGLLHQISQNGATFPSLTTLRLQQYYRTAVADLSGLYSFLKAHHKFIRHLQLRLTVEVAAEIPSGAAFFAHPIFTQVALSSLEYLEMEFYHFPSDYLPSMVPFLNRCRPLRYLAIDCGRSRWSYANLETLTQGLQSTRPLGSLQHSVNSRGLRHLELTLEFFRADVLALLCKFLCHLEILRLNFFTIEPIGYGMNLQGLRIPLFCCELERADISEWTLHTLHLKPLHLINSNRHECKTALVKALPRVKSFCGRTPEDYVNTTDFV